MCFFFGLCDCVFCVFSYVGALDPGLGPGRLPQLPTAPHLPTPTPGPYKVWFPTVNMYIYIYYLISLHIFHITLDHPKLSYIIQFGGKADVSEL